MSKAEYFKARRLELEAQGMSQVDIWESLESVILADSKLFQRWTDAKIKQDALAHKTYGLTARMPKADQSIAEATSLEWTIQRQASMPYTIEPLEPVSSVEISKFIGPATRPAFIGKAGRVHDKNKATKRITDPREDKTTWTPRNWNR